MTDGTKTVIAYFKTREEAEAAEHKLQALRALDTSVNTFGRYPGDAEVGPIAAISGDISSLASLTLNANVDSRDAGILLAADPGASGLAAGAQTVTGHNFVLSAVVPEEAHHQALRAVEESGGYL